MMRRGGERKGENKTPETPTAEEEDTQIEVASAAVIDSQVIFHVISDVLAFLLYMHQQIPSVLQDMTIEFDSLQDENTELEKLLSESQLNAQSRRKHNGRKREVKIGIKRMEKLMNNISAMRNAFQLLITEVPYLEQVTFVLGASPRRPQHVYEICFSRGRITSATAENVTRTRTTEMISRKVIRALISKGVGSAFYLGPSKMFLLAKAPQSFNMPLHFLPKRDLQYPKKVAPLRLQLLSKTGCQEMDASSCPHEPCMGFHAEKSLSSDPIWFQCRHVIKGLTLGNPSPEE